MDNDEDQLLDFTAEHDMGESFALDWKVNKALAYIYRKRERVILH